MTPVVRAVRSIAAAAAVLVLSFGPHAARADEPLPTLNIDPDGISVSGVSSGGYLAQMVHTAHSGRLAGVGVIAGGPYDCMRGDLFRGMQVCTAYAEEMCETNVFTRALCAANMVILVGPDGVPLYQGPESEADIERLAEECAAAVTAAAERGDVDPTAALAGDRYYLFSGTQDTKVRTPLVEALRRCYARLGVPDAAVMFETGVPAAHAMVTDNPRGLPTSGVSTKLNTCATAGESPHINDCRPEAGDRADVAGNLLRHIYGDAALASGRTTDTRPLIRVDQRPFSPSADRDGLDDAAFLYVPESCAGGARCKLHVAFHGCKQSRGDIGDAFARYAGYNSWAERNNIVVLYPQARSFTIPFAVDATWQGPHCDNYRINGFGCWDAGWAYTDRNYATRDGRQARAVAAMIDHLAGRFGPPAALTASRSSGWWLGANRVELSWTAAPAGVVAGYHVYRSAEHPVDLTAANRLSAAPVMDSRFTDSDPPRGENVFYVVTAVDSAGTESRPSLPAMTHACRLQICYPGGLRSPEFSTSCR